MKKKTQSRTSSPKKPASKAARANGKTNGRAAPSRSGAPAAPRATTRPNGHATTPSHVALTAAIRRQFT